CSTPVAADSVPPRITHLERNNTHRLIPARYAEEKTVLSRIAKNAGEIRDIFVLDSVTNDLLLGEANLLPGITVHELVFGVPYAQGPACPAVHAGAARIIAPSVRRRGESCIVCFREVLVTNVRDGVTVTVSFAHANARPEFRVMRTKPRG